MSCRSELPLVKERWRRFRRALKADDQPAMDALIAALEKNGPTTFAGLDDPLEAAVLAVLMEMAREARNPAALVLAGRHV
jgi:hydrogenase maturation factor